jgi:hypothetical protein
LLLYADDVEGARRLLLDSQEGWNPVPYRISHLWILYATAPLDIYMGQPHEAIHAWEEAHLAMKQVFLDRATHVMRNARELYGRACIAAALLDESPGPLIDRARKQATRITSTGNPLAKAQGQNILAGVAALEGDQAEAVRQWTLAVSAFDEQGVGGYAAAVHHRLAQLTSGDTSDTHRTRSREFFAREEVGNPDRFSSVLAPGIALPPSPSER